MKDEWMPIATCSSSDLASFNRSQPVLFTLGTFFPPLHFLLRHEWPLQLFSLPCLPLWLPSAPGEHHVKPSSVSSVCLAKGGDEGDAGADWLELGGRHAPELPVPH